MTAFAPKGIKITKCVNSDLNKKAVGVAPPILLRAVLPLIKCAGVLDSQANGALSSLYAVASPDFVESGAYIVPYARIGRPSDAALDPKLQEKLWGWTAECLREWL